MPWMNRSPNASRAQSVVTSARERIRTPPRWSSSSRSTARPASPSARSGSRASHDWPIGKHDFVPGRTGKKSPAAGFVSRPDPKRGFQPGSLFGQFGHGVRKAADAMHPAILADRLVVNGAELRQPGQQMRREPLERLARTHPALRDLQRFQSPRALQLVARLGQARAEVVGLLRPGPNQRPVLRDQGVGHQRGNLLDHPPRESPANNSRSSIRRSS